jgi:hypothetical protein
LPQNGFHSLIGAAVARRIWPGRRLWVLGFVLGSMIPDVDVLPLAIMRLSGYWGPGVHRTLTHSVFLIGGIFAAAGVAWPRWRGAASFLAAFGLGMIGHVALDLLLWFAGVDLVWPLSERRGWAEVNLWRWVRLPALAGNPDAISNELAALEAVAYGLYLGYLRGRAREAGTRRRLVRFIGVVAAACWVLFPCYVVTGLVWSEWKQNVIVYGPSIVLFFPTSFVGTIGLRRELAAR